MGLGKAGFETESFNPNDIIAGAAHIHDEPIVLASGQNLIRGAVLGKITASGKCVLSLAAAEDGSEDPVGILQDDTDASAADKKTSIMLSGEFDQALLTYGTGHNAASVKAAFAGKGIWLVATTA